MESLPDAKYKKLASEYAKLRAKASVLKKAVLDEQAKEATLREQLRHKETSVRRAEQEIDSLGFRNKQLESRVAALQQEIANSEQHKKKAMLGGIEHSKRSFTNFIKQSAGDEVVEHSSTNQAQEAIVFEELQKKIVENAQLTSLIDDKERELNLYTERVASLEEKLEKALSDHNDVEKRLRKDYDALQHKNSELETKLVEAASMLGSEDALSATGSESTHQLDTLQLYNPSNAQLQQNQTTDAGGACASSTLSTEVSRLAALEKEVAHWRAQYEILKLNRSLPTATPTSNTNNSSNSNSNDNDLGKTMTENNSCTCSTSAAGITVQPSSAESGSRSRSSTKRQMTNEPDNITVTKEQLIYNHFSERYEELLRLKYMSESRLQSYETEVLHLQCCLENATFELQSKDEQNSSLSSALQMLEEDLATTKLNYDDQISVLTEQIISLSEQLAASK